MIQEDKVIVIDLDGVLCNKGKNQKYIDAKPNEPIIKKLQEYKKNDFYIIIQTSRNMRTFQGNIGKINANTLKTIFKWLYKHKIPYDEVHIGKPWCGFKGFYIDDKAIRPYEFLNYKYDTIKEIIKSD